MHNTQYTVPYSSLDPSHRRSTLARFPRRVHRGAHPAATAAATMRRWCRGTGKATSAPCAWTCTSARTCATPATTSSVNPAWGHWLRTAPPTRPAPSAEPPSRTSFSRRVSRGHCNHFKHPSAPARSASEVNPGGPAMGNVLDKVPTVWRQMCANATWVNVRCVVCVCWLQHRHLGRRSLRGPSCRCPSGTTADLWFSSDQMSRPHGENKIKCNLMGFVLLLSKWKIRSTLLNRQTGQFFWWLQHFTYF